MYVGLSGFGCLGLTRLGRRDTVVAMSVVVFVEELLASDEELVVADEELVVADEEGELLFDKVDEAADDN